MKVLIVDDEAPARLELRKLLSVHPDVMVIGEAKIVKEAVDLTAKFQPDAVFLDIQLAGKSGFDYVAQLPKKAPRLVFVTAYDQYAIRAFECNALDYLLKPVHPDRLAETLHRIRVRPKPIMAQTHGMNDTVFIKAGSVAKLIPWKEIQLIKSSGNYSEVVLGTGEKLLVLRPIRKWMEFTPGSFLRVHRTLIVNRQSIRELLYTDRTKRELRLENGETVPVGRRYLANLRKELGS